MVESGYNFIGFFGVSVGTAMALFNRVDGVVRGAVSGLAALCLNRKYFRHWMRMISIAIRQVASDCSSWKASQKSLRLRPTNQLNYCMITCNETTSRRTKYFRLHEYTVFC